MRRSAAEQAKKNLAYMDWILRHVGELEGEERLSDNRLAGQKTRRRSGSATGVRTPEKGRSAEARSDSAASRNSLANLTRRKRKALGSGTRPDQARSIRALNLEA